MRSVSLGDVTLRGQPAGGFFRTARFYARFLRRDVDAGIQRLLALSSR